MSSTTLRSSRLGAAILAGSFLAAALPSATVSAASPTACRVANQDSGVVRRTLQKAVNAATDDDHLTVRGTCHGITIIDRDLRISGRRVAGSGRPTLDGDDGGSVLTVGPDVRVRISGLRIIDGNAPSSGGGAYNQGRLTLVDVLVRGNAAAGASGGGVYNNARLTLSGSTRISGNEAVNAGGGVYNNSTMIMNRSSSVRGNEAGGPGGGVYNNGALTMNGASSVRDNKSGGPGGGVYNNGSFAGGTCAPAPGSNVHDNTPDDCAGP